MYKTILIMNIHILDQITISLSLLVNISQPKNLKVFMIKLIKVNTQNFLLNQRIVCLFQLQFLKIQKYMMLT